MTTQDVVPAAQVMSAADSDLESLTGLRSGKQSFYREYVRSDERMKRAVRAMDSISRVVVRTVEGPRSLLEQVARAVGAHLDAEWTLLGLADGHLPGARPRFVAADGAGTIVPEEDALPAEVRRELGVIRAGHTSPAVHRLGWVWVPIHLEGATIGSIVAKHRLPADPAPGDFSVLRILAGQATVALFTSEQFQLGLTLQRQARRLNDETAAQARDLAARTTQLRRAEQRLRLADQRQLVDEERHRIARELHDTVTQQVLAAGIAVDIASRDAAALGAAAAPVVEQLMRAKDLSQRAVGQLRQAIYALNRPQHDTLRTLPELLEELVRQHDGAIRVHLRVEGDPFPVGEVALHEITRAVGEALFNVFFHAQAGRAVVRLRYLKRSLAVSIADDGVGDPVLLRRHMRLATRVDGDGRHRGLVNIQQRMAELGGTVTIRRARLGGVRLELRLPCPDAEGAGVDDDTTH